MVVQRDFVQVNGGRLYYETAGTGQPLVLIHGFSLDRRSWEDQFEPFARQYRVIRYDLRGFGQSSVPHGQPYAHAGDLKVLLDHLGVARAHLVGLSLGGWVAINFALAYPAATRSLVLADAVLLGLGWTEAYLAAMNPVWAAAGSEGVQAAKELWLRTPLFAGPMASDKIARRLSQIITAYSGWHFTNSDPGQAAADALERLETIMAPALILVGERDFSDFHRIADTLLQIPQARKAVVNGVGHMVNMEAPEQFNRQVLEFLDRL